MQRFVADLERVGYSMLIRRTSTNERIERFSQLTRAIEEGVELFDEGSPLQLTLEEQSITLKCLDGPIYLDLSARACALLLTRIDALVGAEGVDHDYSVVSVEHVLPRNPPQDSQWLQWYSEQSQREQWTNRLGNLVLLSRRKNSAAQNYEFNRKKSAYFFKGGVAPYAITTQVLESVSNWFINEPVCVAE